MENIKRVIFITPENRSAHYVFGCFDSDHSNHYNYRSDGTKVYCSAVEPKSGSDGMFHDIASTLEAMTGLNNEEMSGFVLANKKGIQNRLSLESRNYVADETDVMGYTAKGSMNVLHTLAENYTLCKNWFSSVPADTFSNRLYMMNATSKGQDGNWSVNPFHWFHRSESIFHRLESASRSWKVYYTGMLGTLSNCKLWAPNQVAKSADISQLITDIQDGTLLEYSYVQLTDAESLANGLVAYTGDTEQYIANVYNALQHSSYWSTTLLIIAYDENGGFYDNVCPPTACPPDRYNGYIWPSFSLTSNSAWTGLKKISFDRYGPRVPALLISPWTPKEVDMTIYDHTSALAFVEHLFQLEPLTDRDREANWQFPFVNSIRDIDTLPQNLKSNVYTTAITFTGMEWVGSIFSKVLVRIAKFLTCS